MTAPRVDASGVAVALRRPPQRIVSLLPSTTETLSALGLGWALVGITAYCPGPRPEHGGPVRIGGTKDPQLDTIRALAPDLVVANVEENVRDHVEQLRAWSIPVWVTYPRTVAEGLRMIQDLGDLTGTAPRAAALLTRLESRLERVRAEAASRPAVPVFYPIWRDPYMTIGADTYIHDVLAICGARNVFGDRRERYPEVTLAEVLERRPEVILLPDEPFHFRRAHVEEFRVIGARRIELVDGKLFSWYGPRIAEALVEIPALVRRLGGCPG